MQHWTPDDLERVYELLRHVKPFSAWRLPPGDEVEFHVTRMRAQASCQRVGDRHIIRVSANRHASFAPLIATMAHEMLHMHLDTAYPRDKAHHGRRFHRHADLICRMHTFDRGQF